MPSSATMPPATFQSRPQRERKRSRPLAAILIVLAAVICVVAIIAASLWPFSKARVLQDLREASDSQVAVRDFRRIYLPYPGCILEGVTFQHGTLQAKPLISVDKVTIQGTYGGILAKHIHRITAEGMRVSIPALGTGQAFHTTPSQITVDEFVANGATLEIDSHNSAKEPLRFDIHEAFLQNIAPSGPFAYRVKVHNPEPPGEISAAGKFGGWNHNDAGQTPLSGQYTFEHADLSVYEGIAGKLSSSGKFGGTIQHIDISGTTDTPDFEVKSASHPVHLTAQFSAYVDAMHGDTFLKQVDVDFEKTHVVVEGSIARSANGISKTALLDFGASQARIGDLLYLFIQAKHPPMSGSVALRAHVEIPPGPDSFLKKLKLQGRFGIQSGAFSNPSTQKGVDELSAGARGQKDPSDPETVLTDLTGKVDVVKGIAGFADLSFGVPGASARLHGTYNLLNYKIDLRGQMRVESKLSNSESGGKAVLLKMIEPLFKKKKKGEIVPVRISGNYDHPSFGLDLEDKKAQKVPAPSGVIK
jgi:hypothetical protein